METYKEEPVAKRLRSKIVYMKTSEEEPVAKRLRSTIVNMKTSNCFSAEILGLKLLFSLMSYVLIKDFFQSLIKHLV